MNDTSVGDHEQCTRSQSLHRKCLYKDRKAWWMEMKQYKKMLTVIKIQNKDKLQTKSMTEKIEKNS